MPLELNGSNSMSWILPQWTNKKMKLKIMGDDWWKYCEHTYMKNEVPNNNNNNNKKVKIILRIENSVDGAK